MGGLESGRHHNHHNRHNHHRQTGPLSSGRGNRGPKSGWSSLSRRLQEPRPLPALAAMAGETPRFPMAGARAGEADCASIGSGRAVRGDGHDHGPAGGQCRPGTSCLGGPGRRYHGWAEGQRTTTVRGERSVAFVPDWLGRSASVGPASSSTLGHVPPATWLGSWMARGSPTGRARRPRSRCGSIIKTSRISFPSRPRPSPPSTRWAPRQSGHPSSPGRFEAPPSAIAIRRSSRPWGSPAQSHASHLPACLHAPYLAAHPPEMMTPISKVVRRARFSSRKGAARCGGTGHGSQRVGPGPSPFRSDQSRAAAGMCSKNLPGQAGLWYEVLRTSS